jgi:hypothetical protein
MAAC